MAGKALLLIFLVGLAIVATSFILWSPITHTKTSEDFSFDGSHSIVQVFDEMEPTGIEIDCPGMPG